MLYPANLDNSSGLSTDAVALSRQLSKHAGKIAIAVGDNYTAIRPLILSGIDMYHGATGEKLTGFEKKKRGKNDDGPSQPSVIYFNEECSEPHASGMPPQEFPARMYDGMIYLAIGAGYDLMVNSARKNVHLNGEMSDINTRTANMIKDLEEAGYVGVPLAVKPVVYILMAPRKPLNHGGKIIRTLDDLRAGEVDVIAEPDHILKQYGISKRLNFRRVVPASGGADKQIASGLFLAGTDLLESGDSVIEYTRFVVPVLDKDEKLCIVTYSQPFMLATNEAYHEDKTFFDDLFGFASEAVEKARLVEPLMFVEKYKDFLERFRVREKELMDEGVLTKET